MKAGQNIRVKINRYATPTDDSAGGAQPTGTILYQTVDARMSMVRPTMALLEQGVETFKLFTFSFSDGTLGVREQDELVVIWPYNHPWISGSFRIIGVQQTSLQPSDPRRFLEVLARRSDIAHRDPQY